MNIDYSILWFDDENDFFESLDLSQVEDLIKSWGFTPKIQLVTSPEDFLSKEPFAEFDLIVVDYNLQNYDMHGDKFIRKIRDHAVFTEVIFYSSQEATLLWESIKNEQLEGVFVSNRQNIREKISNVATQTVKKVLDLENMRGLVMRQVGDLDILLDEILTKGLSSITEAQRKAIFDGFHADASKQVKSNSERLEDFKNDPTTEKLLDLCDSSKRWNNFNRLKKQIPSMRSAKIGSYDVEIILPRNCLAHGVPTAHPEKGFIFTHFGKTFHYHEDAGIELRKRILEYKSTFSQILLGIETA